MANKFSIAIKSDAYKGLINNTLGNEEVARKFVADISGVVALNYKLQECDAGTIISAGLQAQVLNLPLSPTLGFAYIIPYGNKAQFQVGWKGLVQLCLRSGKFTNIGVRVVHDGELAGQDEFGEDIIKFDHKFDSKPIIGYFAYFKLNENFGGLKKTAFWTKAMCEEHANKYSQTYKNKVKGNNWETMFDIMAQKTVLKNLLSKYAPMSTELETAIRADQAVINGDKYEYVDNEPEQASEKKTNISNSLKDEIDDKKFDEAPIVDEKK